ncbi:MAG: rhomboid family intramembrane serine protease [Desulfovibrionaceae bacterium]
MIPLRDNIPSVHTPYAMWAIIALNALAWLWTLSLAPGAQFQVFHVYGVTPLRFADPSWAHHMGYPDGRATALFTSLFLHGGFMHLLLNMWMLWIFADNIEDVTGPWRFAAFYLTCGLASLLAHILANPGSATPVIGASGAISGVMGAYAMLYPHAKVRTLIPIIIIPFIFDVPAVLFLGAWLAMQLFSGIASVETGGSGGVAWWAHLGGFAAGAALIPFFRRRGRCYYCFRP